MADTPTPTKGTFGFLSQKVGPLPLGVWAVAGVGIWWYFKKSSASSSSSQQTDPAGNVGSIDPATGYVSGTPEDQAALAANGAGGSTDTSGTGTGTVGGQYADDNAWGVAAVNYLVGIGIDPTEANQAINLYLNSQTLTAQYQGDVNLAIQALGSPPSLPGPTTNNPGPVKTPGGGSGTGGGTGKKPGPPPPPAKPKAPANLRVTKVAATTASLSWSLPSGVKSAKWVVETHVGAATGKTLKSVTTTSTTATISGLTPRTKYTVRVKEDVSGAPFGTVSFTTSNSTVTEKPPIKPPTPPTRKPGPVKAPAPTKYTVKAGDNLSSIAGRYHTTWQALYAANKSVIGSNPNLIKPGEVLTIP